MQRRYKKDSGLSWLICFGSCVVYLLETGVVKSLGVLLPALQSEFSTQTWEIGLLVSLVPGYGAMSCLIVGALRKKFSSRVVLIACGLLSSLGLVMVSYSMSIPILAISLILTGFLTGAAAISFAVLPNYFDKYFDASNAIVHAGISVGLMVIPLVTQFLLQVYGWRGALLIIGGLNCHIIVCGALIRPDQLSTPINNTIETTDYRKHEFEISDIIHILDLKLFTNTKFISLLCIKFGTGYFYIGWLIYVVPHSLDTGFHPYQASAIATVGGVGHLVGSIAFLLVIKKISKEQILYLSTAIVSFSLAIDPILTNSHAYVGLMLTSFAVNAGFAFNCCAIYSAIVDVVGEDEFFNAINWLFASYSLGSIATGYFTGWLFDVYGNYTISYLVLSAVPIISLIPLITVNIKERYMYEPISSNDP